MTEGGNSMIEEATLTTTVAASIDECFAAAVDVVGYPEWAADIKSAEIVEIDDSGYPRLVTFRAAAMGRSTTYTLRYNFSEAPEGISWELDEGDLMSCLDGYYEFAATDGAGTEVTYHLSVGLRLPLPGFVKRRAEGRIIHTALDEFQTHVETVGGSGDE
ncbi:MAG: SRPBCC family protein [Acidimicrobiales bacterium]